MHSISTVAAAEQQLCHLFDQWFNGPSWLNGLEYYSTIVL